MKIVELKKELPVTNSEIVAEGTNRTHKSVIQLIRQYEKQLNEFGTLAFEMRKSGGRPTEIALLNESQVYFLMTLMRNNEIVVLFKKRLVKEFMKMKQALIQLQVNRNNDEWKLNRDKGKRIRKETTDTIQDFVRYATNQGSKNAVKYYGNITKMENKALFILEQKYPNVRQMLNNYQLTTLHTADMIVSEALKDGMEKKLHYKEIYKLAKERVEKLSLLIKPTMVISYEEVKVLED